MPVDTFYEVAIAPMIAYYDAAREAERAAVKASKSAESTGKGKARKVKASKSAESAEPTAVNG